MEPYKDAFTVYSMFADVEQIIDDVRNAVILNKPEGRRERFFERISSTEGKTTKSVWFEYRHKVVMSFSITKDDTQSHVIARWFDLGVTLPFARDLYTMLHNDLDVDFPDWLMALIPTQDETPAVAPTPPTSTITPEPEPPPVDTLTVVKPESTPPPDYILAMLDCERGSDEWWTELFDWYYAYKNSTDSPSHSLRT